MANEMANKFVKKKKSNTLLCLAKVLIAQIKVFLVQMLSAQSLLWIFISFDNNEEKSVRNTKDKEIHYCLQYWP